MLTVITSQLVIILIAFYCVVSSTPHAVSPDTLSPRALSSHALSTDGLSESVLYSKKL